MCYNNRLSRPCVFDVPIPNPPERVWYKWRKPKTNRGELLFQGRITRKEVRKLIANTRNQHGGVSALPKRLETAMYNLRSALAILGLAVESDAGRAAYYDPMVAYVFVAYLRWHDFDKKKSVIAQAMFIRAVLDNEVWTHVYTYGCRMQPLREYVERTARVVELKRVA